MAFRRALPLLLFLFLFAANAIAVEPVVRLSSGPSTIRIEQLPDRQDLNFEIFIDNRGATPLSLRVLQVSAFDAAGRLLLRRQLDDNGVRPSIQTLPERSIAAGQSLTIFNPFASFGRELDLARLHYQLTLVDSDGEAEHVAGLDVRPLRAPGKTVLRLPVRGRAINYDGHDYYAHHRRFDYSSAPLAQMGFKSNFMRYGYDFVPVDAKGAMHRGSGERNEDYFGFGAELSAAGDGLVVALENDRPDDRQFDRSRLAADPMVLFGNYLVIDHGNGEFSVYGHLQQHSVRVKPGQRVRRGELVARIGASGSAFFPHLHYQLQDGPDTRAEGLPSYFTDFQVSNGAGALTRSLATVDTGEIVESR